jgi:hypothetical protein
VFDTVYTVAGVQSSTAVHADWVALNPPLIAGLSNPWANALALPMCVCLSICHALQTVTGIRPITAVTDRMAVAVEDSAAVPAPVIITDTGAIEIAMGMIDTLHTVLLAWSSALTRGAFVRALPCVMVDRTVVARVVGLTDAYVPLVSNGIGDARDTVSCLWADAGVACRVAATTIVVLPTVAPIPVPVADTLPVQVLMCMWLAGVTVLCRRPIAVLTDRVAYALIDERGTVNSNVLRVTGTEAVFVLRGMVGTVETVLQHWTGAPKADGQTLAVIDITGRPCVPVQTHTVPTCVPLSM